MFSHNSPKLGFSKGGMHTTSDMPATVSNKKSKD
jgi:hypothetical protein